MIRAFRRRGWALFPPDPSLAGWVAHALPHARSALTDPALAHWHDCDGTWFVGVDALPNDSDGRIGGSGPLRGRAVAFIRDHLVLPPLHRGQISTVFPGYPRPRRGEGDGAYRYRLLRDAAHVDGLRAVGPDRRRNLAEAHAWILGLPLAEVSADAAPLVVWEGSHRIIGAALARMLAGHPPHRLHEIDLTDTYQAARRKVFDICRRIALPARPGEACLLHRHCLHGIAPWGAAASAGRDGRMIAYFRPVLPGGPVSWIAADPA